MAPMVDRAVIRFPSQVGSAGTRKGVGDRPRPGEPTENRSSIRAQRIPATLLGSRAQRPRRPTGRSRMRCEPGGRLAQLVRALP